MEKLTYVYASTFFVEKIKKIHKIPQKISLLIIEIIFKICLKNIIERTSKHGKRKNENRGGI